MLKPLIKYIVVVLISLYAIHGAKADQTAVFHAHTRAGYLREITAELAWTSEPWTGDDRPYAEARATIDAVCEDENSCRKAAATYETVAEKHPENALSQFMWGYAASIVARSDSYVGNLDELRWKIFDALARPKSPHAYNYARLRFATEPFSATWQQPINGLRDIGQRLLERDPRDYQVKCVLVYAFLASRVPEDRALTVKNINELLRDYPERSYPYECQTMLDYFIWFDDKTTAHARQALDAANKYLSIAPENDSWRKEGTFYRDLFQKKLQ